MGGGGSGLGGRGLDGCERKIKVLVKIKKNNIFFLGGGGSSRGVRVGGDQGRCEQRSEVFVRIQKRNIFFWGGGGQVGGGSGGSQVDVNKELKFL